METFTGIWVPIVTPFVNGGIDTKALQKLTRHLAAGGVNGLVVCGTTGEAGALSEDEQHKVLHTVRECAGPKVRLVMGVAGSHTGDVLRQAKRWAREPIDGLLVCAPYYVRPSQQGLLCHFENVARAVTDTPIIIYNIPYRTGVNITAQTMIELATIPNIVAVKESGSGNIDQLFDLIEKSGLKVLTGEDTLVFITACMGGAGAISAAAHIRPDLFVRVWQLTQQGRIEDARRLFSRLMPMIRLLFSEPNPAPLKAALRAQGWVREELRLPMTPISESCRARLLEQIAAVEAIG